MCAYRGGRSHIIEVEVEVQDVTGLHVQFGGNEVHEQVAFLQLAADDAQQGEHVLLLAQFHSVIDLAVEVYGQVGDDEQGTAYVEQQGTWVQGILTAHDDTACQTEGTVEPGAHDGTAIHLCVQSHDASLAGHLGMGLDAEGGRVTVGTDETEASLRHGVLTKMEGIEAGVVLGHVVLVSGPEGGKGGGHIEGLVPCCLQSSGHGLYGQEVHGGFLQEFNESVYHSLGFFYVRYC